MNKFEVVKNEHRKFPNAEIKLPTRATKHSAGYDIYTPCDITIEPGKTFVVPTDVKVQINEDEVLMIYVRSSVGIKKNICLMNGTGVIDSDYYGNPKNDGNMALALFNYGTETQSFKAGDAICQGIFMKYNTVEDDHVETIRVGGIGSTSKNCK